MMSRAMRIDQSDGATQQIRKRLRQADRPRQANQGGLVARLIQDKHGTGSRLRSAWQTNSQPVQASTRDVNLASGQAVDPFLDSFGVRR